MPDRLLFAIGFWRQKSGVSFDENSAQSTMHINTVGFQKVVPLLMVQDMERSLTFYVDGLGFEVKNTWTPDGKIRWCWLEFGGAAFMLQEWAASDPHQKKLGGHVGAGVGFYCQCQDSIAFYKIAKARGLSVRKPFVGNSMWVTSLADPDGYSLHFQSPTMQWKSRSIKSRYVHQGAVVDWRARLSQVFMQGGATTAQPAAKCYELLATKTRSSFDEKSAQSIAQINSPSRISFGHPGVR